MNITYKQVKDSASKFRTSKEWRKKYPSHASKAYREGWIPEICSHMVRKKPKGTKKYTVEQLHKEALRYTTRKDFGQFSRKEYVAACRYGVMDTICSHMYQPTSTYSRKKIYVLKSELGYYVGITCNLDRRFSEHRVLNENSDIYWGIVVSQKDYPAKIAAKGERRLINHFKKLGVNLLNQTKGGEVGSRLKYTDSDVKAKVGTCKYLSEFYGKYPKEVKAIQMRGSLFRLTAPLRDSKGIGLRKPQYRHEDILEKAKVSKSAREFKEKYRSYYNAAYTYGIYPEVKKLIQRKN